MPAAKSCQSCLTLCDPIDSSPPGSAVPGILQARTLEWVAISFSNAWKRKVKVKSLSCMLGNTQLITTWSISSTSISLSSGIPIIYYILKIVPQFLGVLFLCFLFFLFLGERIWKVSIWPVFKFSDSFFGHIKSTNETTESFFISV